MKTLTLNLWDDQAPVSFTNKSWDDCLASAYNEGYHRVYYLFLNDLPLLAHLNYYCQNIQEFEIS